MYSFKMFINWQIIRSMFSMTTEHYNPCVVNDKKPNILSQNKFTYRYQLLFFNHK